MKSVRIRLTPEQEAQLAPVTAVLEEHSHTGVGTVGQVLFYADGAELLIGVMKRGPFGRVKEFTRNDCNLFDLPGTGEALIFGSGLQNVL